MNYHECALSGVSGPQVRVRLVEWAEPIHGKQYDSLAACTDVRECRERVEQRGETWPLREAKVTA
jgi:hypothetical protein